MANHTVVFLWTTSDNPQPESSGPAQPPDDAPDATAVEHGNFSRIFGALKGTVTIAPGTELTAPVWEACDKKR